ncbi:helix-turn-helix transcriptional regulator [Microbispora sp. RL4-1S]|uniref:Helix-turn-helix transcriptional regulator n=1 Tax=Microbispora oryzae TaxID=2806554 RepID=A0A940WQ15_9ACTN|nr:helix-turn-helix transcriptional regulator [Microbispora oryzae]MBP2705021.1 helix-turn-helix transcriptional regulator [Microbispora oryzae]
MAYKPPFTRASGGAPPTGPATLRRANLSLVLRERASLSRADIAQATGLHRATVSNLIADIARGLASGDRRVTMAVAGAASMVINHIIDDPTTIMDLPRPTPY